MTPQIDSKSLLFLKAVHHHDGEANTTQIREHSDLSQNETKYRFKKLAKSDFITVHQPEDSPGGRVPAKVATLTDKGEQYINSHGDTSQSETPEYIPTDLSDPTTEKRLIELEDRVTHLEELLGTVIATHPNLPDYDTQ